VFILQTSSNRNNYEIDNHLSASPSDNQPLSGVVAVTKFTTSTVTTTTVVTATSNSGSNSENANLFSRPEGDHSTQHTSSAASSWSHGSGQRDGTSNNERSCAASTAESASSQVEVFVHRGKTQEVRIFPKSDHSRCSLSDTLAKSPPSCHVELRRIGSSSVPNSPCVNRASLNNKETSQKARSWSPGVVRCSSAALQVKIAPDHSETNERYGEESFSKSSLRLHSSRGSRQELQHSPERDFVWDSKRMPCPKASLHSRSSCQSLKHLSGSSRQSLHREQQTVCKWCYADHRSCLPQHNVSKQAPSHQDDPAARPLLRRQEETFASENDEESCPCPYHFRNGQRPEKIRSSDSMAKKQAARSRSAGSPHDRQTSPLRSLSAGTAALHGSFHRSSSSYSSSPSLPPSPFSSSSHSCQRRRKTKLEDIQEHADSSAAEQELRGESDTRSAECSVGSHRNTPSTLHSSRPVSVDSTDFEHARTHTEPGLRDLALPNFERRSLALSQEAKTVIEGAVKYNGV